MKKHIHIGNVKLPLRDYVISGTGVLGIKKAGKTYLAKGIAEQLLDNGIPIIVFDAIGVWRYLKTPGSGRGSRGYEVVVAGGEAPDLPLTADNAAEIVRAAMRSNVSLVIDLYSSDLSKSDWRKIVQTCFRTLLYENKAYGPRHVFLEEAAEYVPQKVYDGATYSEVEKFVRMGGNAQLGITLINQRSQEVNKSVLDLCDNLVLMRQRGNSAIDAVQKWMDKVSPDIADHITTTLPNMTQGDCWVWAEDSDTPVFTRSARINSYHPDRTLRQQMASNQKSVDVNIFVTKLRADLGKVVEEKKANDTGALHRRIRELEAELRKAPAPLPKVNLKPLELTVKTLEHDVSKISGALTVTQQSLEALKYNLSNVTQTAIQPVRVTKAPTVTKSITPIRETVTKAVTNGDLTGPERKILTTLAQYKGQKIAVRRLAILTNYAHTGGAFRNPLSSLRSKGLVEGRDPVEITAHGCAEAGPVPPPLTGEALREQWLQQLPGPESSILKVLLDAEGAEMTPEEIAASAINSRGEPYEPSGGAFRNPLSKLRTLCLVTGRDKVKAADTFFE